MQISGQVFDRGKNVDNRIQSKVTQCAVCCDDDEDYDDGDHNDDVYADQDDQEGRDDVLQKHVIVCA